MHYITPTSQEFISDVLSNPAEVKSINEIKNQLFHLYNQSLDKLVSVFNTFPHDDLGGPFLMSPGVEYTMQRVPFLVVGQEATGWTYHVDNPEKQMRTYEQFELGKTHQKAPFWAMVRKLEQVFGNDPYSCAWTNLSRYDFYGGRSHGRYEKAISSLDRLVPKEIEILKPKVCLFFTGPYFDQRLSQTFPGIEMIEIEGWDPKQFCLLKHPSLPVASYRSYHPKFLKLRSLEQKFIEYFESLNL